MGVVSPRKGQFAFAEFAYDLGEKLVFGGVDPGFEGFEGFAFVDADGGLVDDGAGIDGGSHPMHGTTGVLGSVIVGLLDGMETRKGREETGVEIDDAAMECFDKGRFQNTKEPGKDKEVGLPLLNFGDPLLFSFVNEFGFVLSGVQVFAGNAENGGMGEKRGILSVRTQGDGFGLAELTSFLGFENGFGVGAGTRT